MRIAVRSQPRSRLVPDEIALGHQADRGRPGSQVGAGEHISAVLVRIADDDHGIAALAQDPPELAEDDPHPFEEGRVVDGVGQVLG